MVVRHDARNYDRRRGRRGIAHEGERWGRLLCLSWVGLWHTHHYYKCACDCGGEVITIWKNVQSCGCLQDEVRKARDFRVHKPDGTWGHNHAKPITIQGQRFRSQAVAARSIGISVHTLQHRMKHWPEERWMDPGIPTGAGEKKHRKRFMRDKRKLRATPRPQPWAAETMRKVNERSKAVRQMAPDQRPGLDDAE